MQEQRDLGVFVHKSLKVVGQVYSMVSKGFSILGFISRGIEYKSNKVTLNLYI